MKYLIDIHPAYQSWVDWELLAQENISGVIIKATEGWGYEAKRYPEYVEGAKSVGLPHGAYHYYFGADPMQQQAEYFLQRYIDGAMIAWLDFEDIANVNNKQTTWRKIGEAGLQWMDYVGQRVDDVGIYSGAWYMNNLPIDLQHEYANKKWKWAASYPIGSDVDFNWKPILPNFWDDYTIHQFSSSWRTEAIKSAWRNPVTGKWIPYASSKVDINKAADEKYNDLIGVTPEPPQPPPTGKTYEDAYNEIIEFSNEKLGE